MIGVVVWSCAAREQAVIWCDDHAALALLSTRRDYCDTAVWPQPGDMLELASETLGAIRHARMARPLDESPRSALPAMLQGRTAPPQVKPAPHLTLVHDASPRPAEPATPVPLPAARASGA